MAEAKAPSYLLIGLLLVACARPAPAPAGLVARSPRHEVRVVPVPDPIPLNEHFELRLTVASGEPPERVVVDANMPAHKHGMNTQTRVVPEGPRAFRVEGMLFHMPGDWELVIDLFDAKGRRDRATLVLTLE